MLAWGAAGLLVPVAAAVPDARAAAPAHAAKARGRSSGPGVRVLFDQAQQLFDAGKYADALAAYRSLLHRFPGHQPATIQLAKTLYRLERIKEAQQVFAKLNPKEQDFDPETSYEYGWSFYTGKLWEQALAGFQRVPAGHSLYDLANYYGAVCAIKLKRLEVAEEMLDKAVVLPDKLAKSRSLYIKHVQALRLMHERASLAQERAQEKNVLTLKGTTVTAEVNKPVHHEPPTVVISDTLQHHQGFKSLQRSALVKYQVDHQNITANGTAQAAYDASTASFTFANGYLQPLPVVQGKDFQGLSRQGAVGLQLALTAENRASRGTEQRILSDETWQSLTRQLNQNLGESKAKSGQAEGELWCELPLPGSIWATAAADYSLTYYDFQRGERIGNRRASVDIRGKFQSGQLGGLGTYAEILGVDGSPLAQVTSLKGSGDIEILPRLMLEAGVTYDQFDYIDRGIDLDGPDNTTLLETSLTQRLPLGIKIDLRGSYQQQSNYIFRHVPSFPALSADGVVLTGKGGIEIQPFPFLAAGVRELISTTKWNAKNANAADSFAVAVPTYVEFFTVWAALNLAF